MKRLRLIEAPDPTIDRAKEPERWQQNKFEYIDLIRQVIRMPLDRVSGRGVSIEEMRQGIRILDALEGKQAGDILELEDADHAHLVAKVKAFPWAFVDRRLLQFCATIENATDTVLDEPTPAAERQNGQVVEAAPV